MTNAPRTIAARDTLAPTLSLFASTSTLLCCALPALMVSIGAGATLAGLVSTAPWLIALSQYKGWLFAGSGLLLLAAFAMQRRAANFPCPADPVQAAACTRLRRLSATILWISAAIWANGFFFAFLAADLLL